MEEERALKEDMKRSTDPFEQDLPPPKPEPHREKQQKIREACRWRDAQLLRELATSDGGLVTDDLRRTAWPILLGYNSVTDDDDDIKCDIKHEEDTSWKELPKHRDEDQVALDVNRSFIYYPKNQSPEKINQRKEELSILITHVLRQQPYLCYFQGYHDISQVFLLVLGVSPSTTALAHLSTLRIRDFMLPTLAPALSQLRLIPSILNAVNPTLCAHLSQTQPFFALSGTLTMYAHDIQEYGDIARLFDVLLAREAVFSVYVFAQIVLNREEELFETPADEPEMLHSILSKLPKPLNLEKIIADTVRLFEKYPPENLRAWRGISKNSVLKTARWQEQMLRQHVEEEGKAYFERQVRELEWAERRDIVLGLAWKYRRPVGALGMSLLVGLLSIYLRKSGASSSLLTYLHEKVPFFSAFANWK